MQIIHCIIRGLKGLKVGLLVSKRQGNPLKRHGACWIILRARQAENLNKCCIFLFLIVGRDDRAGSLICPQMLKAAIIAF